MPGPPPKKARGTRRGAGTGGFRQLAAVPAAKVPAWPLAEDTALAEERDQLAEQLASWQAQHDAEPDRRKRHRLRQYIARDRAALAVLEGGLEGSEVRELALWSDLWTSPQAAIWAESPATVREVALYVRWMIRAERGDLRASAEARQLSDRLGINPLALLKLRAEIENVDEVMAAGRERRKRLLEAETRAIAIGQDPARATDPRGSLFS